MRFSVLAAVLSSALTLGAAAPSKEQLAARTVDVTLTFWAAAGNTYQLTVPGDGNNVAVQSDLSFTSISSDAPFNYECQAHGVDGSVTTLFASAQNVPIGPPQQQVSAFCLPL